MKFSFRSKIKSVYTVFAITLHSSLRFVTKIFFYRRNLDAHKFNTGFLPFQKEDGNDLKKQILVHMVFYNFLRVFMFSHNDGALSTNRELMLHVEYYIMVVNVETVWDSEYDFLYNLRNCLLVLKEKNRESGKREVSIFFRIRRILH